MNTKDYLYWWIGVYPNDNTKKIVLIGCKTEEIAEKYITKLNNISDNTVYIIEFYGETTKGGIKTYYNKNNFSDYEFVFMISGNKSFKTVNTFIYDNLYKKS